MGQWVRQTYFPDVEAPRVYAMSTDKSRTVASASAQLEGFYGESMNWPSVERSDVRTITVEDD
jgi:hypothetical protein